MKCSINEIKLIIMNRLIAFAAVILMLMSCERDMVFDTISVTEPELHVIVKDVDGNTLSGVAVSIYKTMDDLNNGTGVLGTSSTDNNGKAVFTESQLEEPGKFYVKAESNSLTASAETPYLLLNDGHTYFNITLQ